MEFLENNRRPERFRVFVILYASMGAEAAPRGQGWAPPAGPGGAAATSRPWPLGGPPGRPLVSDFLLSHKKSP